MELFLSSLLASSSASAPSRVPLSMPQQQWHLPLNKREKGTAKRKRKRRKTEDIVRHWVGIWKVTQKSNDDSCSSSDLCCFLTAFFSLLFSVSPFISFAIVAILHNAQKMCWQIRVYAMHSHIYGGDNDGLLGRMCVTFIDKCLQHFVMELIIPLTDE